MCLIYDLYEFPWPFNHIYKTTFNWQSAFCATWFTKDKIQNFDFKTEVIFLLEAVLYFKGVIFWHIFFIHSCSETHEIGICSYSKNM